MPKRRITFREHYYKRGFTLIELLVVIAVIGLLAGVVLAATAPARDKARAARASTEVQELRTAAEELYSDTDKYPGGCPFQTTIDTEIDIADSHSGLLTPPPVGVFDAPCGWTAADVAKWRGPYLSNPSIANDPWGNFYIIDYDYFAGTGDEGAYPSCPSKFKDGAAIATAGPDNLWYDCDDVNSYLWNGIFY